MKNKTIIYPLIIPQEKQIILKKSKSIIYKSIITL